MLTGELSLCVSLSLRMCVARNAKRLMYGDGRMDGRTDGRTGDKSCGADRTELCVSGAYAM